MNVGVVQYFRIFEREGLARRTVEGSCQNDRKPNIFNFKVL